jgi:hypothetical protein
MEQIAFPQYSYAILHDPAVVQAAAERAAKWDLPRRICRPLDRRVVAPISADLAAYDAAIEQTPERDA